MSKQEKTICELNEIKCINLKIVQESKASYLMKARTTLSYQNHQNFCHCLGIVY